MISTLTHAVTMFLMLLISTVSLSDIVHDPGIFRFNNERTGNAGCLGISRQPHLIWSVEMDGYGYLLYSEGVLVSYCAFMITGLDSMDGSTMWTYSPDEQMKGIPQIADGLLYFCTSSGYRSGTITILDLHSGDVITRIDTGNHSVGPVIHDGTVISGLTEGGLIAIQPLCDSIIWNLELPGLHAMTMSLSEDLLVTAFMDNRISGFRFLDIRRLGAFEATTGKPVWLIKLGPFDAEYLPISSNLIIVPIEDSLVAVDIFTGEIRWQVAERVVSQIACTTDKILFCDAHGIVSLDLHTGARLASRSLPGGEYDRLILCENTIYLTRAWCLLCLDVDLEPLWAYAPVRYNCIAIDNTIFSSIGNMIYALGS